MSRLLTASSWQALSDALPLIILACAAMITQRPAPHPVPKSSQIAAHDGGGRSAPADLPVRNIVYLGPPRIMGAYLQATADPGSLVAASGAALDQFSLWIASSVYPQVLGLRTDVTARLWTVSNPERLLALDPSAVVAWLRTELMERVGLPVVRVSLPSGLGTMAGTYRALADVAGRGERVPELVCWHDSADAALAQELDASSLATRPRVLAMAQGQAGVLWAQAGGDAGVTGTIERAGGRNAVPGNAVVHRLDAERVLAVDPDVIILAGDPQDGLTSPAAFLADPRWRTLRAVAQGQVYARPLSSAFYFDDLLEGPLYTRWLAELLHPDRMRPALRAAVRRTYQRALGYELSEAQVDRALSVPANRGMRDAARFEVGYAGGKKDGSNGRP